MVRRFASRLLVAGIGAFGVALSGCGTDAVEASGASGGGDAFDFGLPPEIPRPRVPADNPMTNEKVVLGRYLFYDTRLSLNETQSCATCHLQELAFTDGRPRSIGSTGDVTPRSSMSLANVAYVATLTWANPTLVELEDQALVPMFGEDPIELGLSGQEATMLERLRTDSTYASLFAAAFPGESEPVSLASVVRAIASFERTLLSFDSPYDRFAWGGQADALTASQKRGLDLFFSDRLECFHCHGGFNFSDSVVHEGTAIVETMFHNTGLYNVDGKGAYPADNTGLFEHSGIASDMGRFRAPSLRNIALTAPYMHDGSIATLDEVLDHYAAGGRTIVEGPNAGVGSASPWKSEFVHGFTLSAQERADMLAFLESLTDPSVATRAAWSSPFSPP